MNCIEILLILASTFTGCFPIFAFVSVVDIPVGITSSAVGLKVCVITAGIKMYMPITKKKKKNDKTVLLAKITFNKIEVLISKSLADSYRVMLSLLQ